MLKIIFNGYFTPIFFMEMRKGDMEDHALPTVERVVAAAKESLRG